MKYEYRKKYFDELIKKKDNVRVKIITYIMKCGKSYLFFELYKNYLTIFLKHILKHN